MVTLIMFILMVTGCQTREIAKATRQSEQAIQAVEQLVKPSMTTEETSKAKALLVSARESLAPVLEYLGEGTPTTSSSDALYRTDWFIKESTKQIVRAEAEVREAAMWNGILAEISDSWLTTLSIALTGSGAAGLAIAKVLKTIRMYKAALEDQVAYTKDRQAANNGEAIVAVKHAHANRQRARGTKPIIDAVLKEHNANTDKPPIS